MSVATTVTPETPAPGVTWSDGVVVLRDARLFGPGGDRLRERFLGRVFGVEGVVSVALDREAGTAAIRHGLGPVGLPGLLGRLSAALRDDRPPGVLPALPRGAREASCTVHRHGALLSTCEVVSDRPGRLRLRHESFRRDPALAERAERLLATVQGVRRATLSTWTGSLVIVYDPDALGIARLVRLAEEALDPSGVWDRALPAPVETRFGLANVNLGLAAAVDFAVPALMPVSAGLLLYNNVRTFRVAWLQARRRQFGLPALYLVIVATTLASGQFLASALMSWCFKFWHGRLRVDLAAERRRLIEECLPLPSLARLITPDGGEVLVPVDRLAPGDRVAIEPGEPAPADGRVVEGEAIVDERGVSGLQGASRKRPGDAVLAGSTLLAGSIRVEVTSPADRTRAAAIGRALVSASSPAPGPLAPSLRAEQFADRAVGPTLATAGLGLLVGDLAAAGAILRPDYATGPGVAVPLEALRGAAVCARRGIVARTPDALDRLAAADLIVLDDSAALRRLALEVVEVRTELPEAELLRSAASAFRHLADDRAPALAEACRARRAHLLDLPPIAFGPGVTVLQGKRRVRVRDYVPTTVASGPLLVEVDEVPVGLIGFGRSSRPEAAAALERIRAQAAVPVVLASGRAEAEVAPLAAALGIGDARAGLGPGDLARLLDDCRARGRKAAFVGDVRRHPEAAARAYVSVSVPDGDAGADLEADPAAVILLQPRLDLFAELWEVARAHAGRVRSAQQFILLPNLLCVAGAFLLGGTALTSVLVSNLGTFGLYSHTVGSLRALDPPGRGRPGARPSAVSRTS